MELYPLRFRPIFQTYLWGGRRLESELNKPIGDQPTYAESWELVDHDSHQSIVQYGPAAGQTLGDLVERQGPELLGESVYRLANDPSLPANLIGRFPLLFKFLDAAKHLSVQVHPDDRMGATLDPPDLGKTESWYVLDALPGSRIYAGLKPGVTPDDFKSAIRSQTAEQVLHSFEPRPGDCVHIPAGTVHAIGAGLLVAEIQQCSNTTFRLYDWGRVDKDGKARELHVEQGIASTDFQRGPIELQQPRPVDDQRECLVECDKFRLDRVRLSDNWRFDTGGTFKFLVVLNGQVNLENDPVERALMRGDTCLIPASTEQGMVEVEGNAELLWISCNP